MICEIYGCHALSYTSDRSIRCSGLKLVDAVGDGDEVDEPSGLLVRAVDFLVLLGRSSVGGVLLGSVTACCCKAGRGCSGSVGVP